MLSAVKKKKEIEKKAKTQSQIRKLDLTERKMRETEK